MYWGDGADDEFNKHQQMMASLSQYLVKIRQKVSADLDQFPPLINQLQCDKDRLRSTENLRTITRFISAVQSVSSTTTSLMTMFTSLVISKAVGVCGKAPCSFSVVRMGSLAKGETTPYSDLEFLFLIDRRTEEMMKYFERLAVTAYFIIGNLKETKLKYMNIEELTGWFDDKSTNGFKIDGLSVNAGNIPTGNGSTQPRYRMIMTVDEAAMWYKRVFTMPNEKDSIRGDESAMFSNTCHIYGEKRLHDNFTSRISSLFQNSSRKAATKAMISNDIEKFVFLPDQKLVEIRNVKEDLFRFPSLMVFDLRQFHQIWAKNSWAVIEELRRLSIISSEAWLSLKFLYSVGVYCRLAAYQHCGSQVDDFSVLPTIETYQLPKPVLIHLFIHLIPVREALKQYITMGNSVALRTKLPLDDNLALSLTHYYYGDHRQFNELIEERCDGEAARLCTELRLMYVYGLIKCQGFDAAENIVNNTLDVESVGLGTLFQCYCLLGDGYHEGGQYRKSLDILKRAETSMKNLLFNVAHPTVASIFYQIGRNYQALGENDSALQYLELTLSVVLSIYKHIDHPGIASAHNNMGNLYYSQGNYGKALQSFEKSLNIRLKVYGHTDDPNIASSYNNLACVYDSQGDYTKALMYHKKSLNMRLNIYRHTDHPDLTSSYNNMASIYYSQGDYNRALQYLEKSLSMQLNIYGHTDHPGIASLYSHMANVYYSQGDYFKALLYHEKSLCIRLAVHQASPHSDVVDSYLSMGDVSMSLSDFSSAVRYYQESLSSLQQLFCNAEKVEFLYTHDKLLTAHYFNWYNDCSGN